MLLGRLIIRAAFTTLLGLSRVSYGAELQVVVGGPIGVLQFDPTTVAAVPGDTILFVFKQNNHTATQSTFDNPCVAKSDGFDTGFIPVGEDSDGPFPVVPFNVTGTGPVWVFCRQANHCQQGMVFAINPGDKFSMFRAAALEGTSVASTSVGSSPPLTTISTTSSSAVASQAVSTLGIPSPSTSSRASSASSATIIWPIETSSDYLIIVGGPNRLFFSPSNISAQVGDTVTFQFQQENHTITQSTFAQPCISLTKTSTSGQIGFDSGFMPVAANATSFPIFTIQINDTSPIWAFCRQHNHCGEGMVFSVNAPETGPTSFTAYQARAQQLNGTDNDSTFTSSAQSSRLLVPLTRRSAGLSTTSLAILALCSQWKLGIF